VSAIQTMPVSLLLAIGAVFLGPAVGLLWWGLWPRHRGSDPHCRHCGYNLTGLESTCCPECGQAWTSKTVLIGELHRRPKAIVAGIACAGIALAALGVPTYRFAASIDPFHFKPTVALLQDIKSPDWVVAGRALAEMERRIGTWRVSQGQLEQFVGIVWPCRLRVRPRCIASEGVPYELRIEEADVRAAEVVPGLPGVYRQAAVLDIEPRVLVSRCWWDGARPDEWPFPTLGGSRVPMSIGGKASLPVGRHTLHYQVQIVYLRAKPEGAGNETILRQEVFLEATCDVMETEPPDYLTVVRDPSSGAVFRNGISSMTLALCASRYGSLGDTLVCDINLAGPAPEDAAFEVIARVEGKEYPIGEALCQKGQTQWQDQKTFYCSYNGPHAASADVILRGSQKLARDSLDMFGTWEGEIVFPDVPISIR
jgi:hypothetical protein